MYTRKVKINAQRTKNKCDDRGSDKTDAQHLDYYTLRVDLFYR